LVVGFFIITFGLNIKSFIMSSPKFIKVQETVLELKKLLKSSPRLIFPRIRMLLEIKKHEELGGISKRNLAEAIGVNHNSIQTWRTLYAQGGIKQLIKYTKNEGRPTILSDEEHNAIKSKLNDSKNGLRGYVELLDWVENTFKKEIKYNTLLKYTNREFGASVKVARKSHVKKDPEAVSAFKKTSRKSAKKPVSKQAKNTKK
jgi:transposase